MTKTLHLYEDHFKALIEEAWASEQKVFATAVLEPFTGQGQGVDPDAMPGTYVGGHNFMLSCGCLCKIVDCKPYSGGYLVRMRGEGRLGISGLAQVEPYMRASVYSLLDQPVTANQTGEVRVKLEELEEVMRDVQNLASKFRSDETASIQQAMWWVHRAAMVPGVMPRPRDMQPPAAAQHVSGVSGSEQAAHSAAEQQGRGDLQGESTNKEAVQDEGEMESEEDIVERAARLSFAALQWLPQSSNEERFFIIRGRLMAMETCDVLQRLTIAISIMSAARSSLAA
eukprot:CAMPEP_0202918050 /NCGR_PEP_ID=MMETSP1392-20130828/72530_1 /ASSEMBLY_ACC=CAM_ASM_000868 /TAXON_ID=225041 /ORGANISM="Chlamydomonas chlamydogama, Strain SAG 11-48b" /LENGTH=283 /DNA_ID=CAMNT_0049610987 /DNA_START=96 /DNA_END=944 /DNA_ORIENTATION=+